MTINQLENFVAVAEAGSFSAAAQKLFISPQALIQQIAKLERELGFRLLSRNTKGVQLTAAGELYCRGLKNMLKEYHQCTEQASAAAQKSLTLRIGLPAYVNPTFMLSICRQFNVKYPEYQLFYETYSTDDTIRALTQGRIDVCAQIKDSRNCPYFSQRLFPVRHYCLVSANNPLAGRDSVRISDMVGQTVGVWGDLNVYHRLSAYIAQDSLDIRLRGLPESLSEVVLFCVKGHVLIACAPVVNSLKSSLDVIPIDFDFGLDYYISYTDNQNEAVQRFLHTAKTVSATEQDLLQETFTLK